MNIDYNDYGWWLEEVYDGPFLFCPPPKYYVKLYKKYKRQQKRKEKAKWGSTLDLL